MFELPKHSQSIICLHPKVQTYAILQSVDALTHPETFRLHLRQRRGLQI
jgi:hypothetical protein